MKGFIKKGIAMKFPSYRQAAGFDDSGTGFLYSGLRFRLFCAVVWLLASGSVQAQDPTTNQLPNPQLRGTNGSIEDGPGPGTGTVNTTGVPTLWRAFAVSGGDITLEIVPLAADAIYAGSPATNAVRLTVNAFGGDQGFDTSPVRFSLVPDRLYQYKVYLKSDNADNSSQNVNVGVPKFDQAGAFVDGNGSDTETATTTWTQFTGPNFSKSGIHTAELAFRLGDDGGDNSVLIALPEIAGPSITNLMPNIGFEGTGGTKTGNVSGVVPDSWRGFAVNGSAITLATVPVAANELYPGSPPTNAVQLTVNTFMGASQGFDNELVRVPIIPASRSFWGEVYLKTANADNSPQGVTMQVNAFSAAPAFLGGPGPVVATATTSWGYFGSFSYLNVNTATADLAFRLIESGANNSVLIAMPRISGITNLLFEDGFEDP